MTLGQRLTACRERLLLRQQDVADKLGWTNKQLSNYERDYREPNIERLIQLADFYGVTVQWLVTGKEIDLADLLSRRGVSFEGVEIPDEVKLDVLQLLRIKMGGHTTSQD
jgi:transcriptional regulator with XRE-family HTH domain